MSKHNKVSIVINTLNRAKTLKNTLQSLCYLDYSNFEVIVVNGPSTDETALLLENWKETIKIGNCAEANLSMSRNIGVAMASGDIIAFIDDDAIPEPEWLTEIITAFDEDDIVAVGGKTFDHTGYNFQYQYVNANRLGNAFCNLSEASPQYCFPGTYQFPYVVGTNAVFRKSALLEIGGFDEAYAYYLEETDACLRLIDQGYRIKQLDVAYIHHKFAASNTRNSKKILTNRYSVLKSKIYFSNRHGKPYHSQEEIDADNQLFANHHRNDILWHIESGNLTLEHLNQFEEHLQQALEVGRRESKEPAKLITKQLLQQQACKFKKFQTLDPGQKKLIYVFFYQKYDCAEVKVDMLARKGHQVHVITKSLSYSTVDFEHGIWVHRIEEDNENSPNYYFNELERIARNRTVDIIDTPISE